MEFVAPGYALLVRIRSSSSPEMSEARPAAASSCSVLVAIEVALDEVAVVELVVLSSF